MDNSHLFDENAQKSVAPKLRLLDRAKLKLLPEYLSIKQICAVLFPVEHPAPKDGEARSDWYKNKREMDAYNGEYKKKLIKACEDGLLEYKKVAKKEFYIPSIGESFRYDDRDIPGLPRPTTLKYYPSDYTIHKDEFKHYLESTDVWPIGGLLVNWWAGDKETQHQTAPPPKIGTKKNKLSCLIWRAYLHLIGNNQASTAQAVWNEIRYHHQTHDEDEIIQEVTATDIYWQSTDSNSPSLNRSSFDAKLSKLKAAPPF